MHFPAVANVHVAATVTAQRVVQAAAVEPAQPRALHRAATRLLPSPRRLSPAAARCRVAVGGPADGNA